MSDRRRLSGRGAIVGVDESDETGIVPHKSPLELHAEAARNALADAGIDLSEVDGVFTAGPGWSPSLQVAEYLRIQPKYTDGTAVGGSSFVIHVAHAPAPPPAAPGGPAPPPGSPAPHFEIPSPAGGPPSVYALACPRHMHQYGTTHEQ